MVCICVCVCVWGGGGGGGWGQSNLRNQCRCTSRHFFLSYHENKKLSLNDSVDESLYLSIVGRSSFCPNGW